MRDFQAFDPGGGTGVLAPPRERTRGRGRRPRPGGPPGRPPREGNGDGDDGRGGDGPGDEGPQGGQDGEPRPRDPRPADTGAFALALTLVGISTLFAVIVAIWILLRLDHGDALGSPATPGALWASTAWLVLSSVTFELALRAVRPGRLRRVRAWLALTLVLGLAFVANQLYLWKVLSDAGQVPSASGYAAILFVVTGLHAVHLAGGLAFIAWLIGKDSRDEDPRARGRRLRLGAVYWHFMGLLWAGLFTLLIVLR